MSLLDNIKAQIEEEQKEIKKEKILEVREEVEYMIKNKIPMTKQIKILQRNGVINSIDYKYYRQIIKKYFKTASQEKVKKVKKVCNNQEVKKAITPNKKSATAMLSESVELAF